MELIAEQDWVREQCSKQDSKQLLHVEKLGDASLSPAQVTVATSCIHVHTCTW